MRGVVRSATLLALALTAACRDVGRMSDVPEFEWPDGSPRVITFSLGLDRNPTWSVDGDSVYYAADSYLGVPAARGVLLAAPHRGGTVRPVFPFLHGAPGGSVYHAAPAISPDGRRIAFFDIVREAPAAACVGPVGPCHGTQPRLERARLVVRDVDESSGTEPALLDVVLPGRAPRLFQPFTEHAYPYHELYAEDGRITFTVAWAPDGEQVVFSDGVALYLWTPGTTVAQRVPNVEYALHPAWSPDGEWIAFMQLAPVSTMTESCACDDGATAIVRTTYDTRLAMIALVRPDGSGVRVLRSGQDPAFASDGTLYARVGDAIARVDLQTGAETPVAGTQDGYEPAISPDGRLLAFTRRPASGGSDIWIVELDAP